MPLAITLLCEVRTFLDSTPDLSDRHEPRPPGQLVRDDPRYPLQDAGASNYCSIAAARARPTISIVDWQIETRKDAMSRWKRRVDSGDWDAIAAAVDEYGGALLPQLITPSEAARLRKLYADDSLFCSTIDIGS